MTCMVALVDLSVKVPWWVIAISAPPKKKGQEKRKNDFLVDLK